MSVSTNLFDSVFFLSTVSTLCDIGIFTSLSPSYLAQDNKVAGMPLLEATVFVDQLPCDLR